MTPKKTEYPRKVESRVSEEIYQWYQKEAENRKLSVSEFLRLIPDMLKTLWEEFDEKDNKILELEEQLKNSRSYDSIMSDHNVKFKRGSNTIYSKYNVVRNEENEK